MDIIDPFFVTTILTILVCLFLSLFIPRSPLLFRKQHLLKIPAQLVRRNDADYTRNEFNLVPKIDLDHHPEQPEQGPASRTRFTDELAMVISIEFSASSLDQRRSQQQQQQAV